MSVIKEFSSFLLDSNLGNTVVATIISTYVTELGISFSENVLLPIIDQDIDGDGKPDKIKLNKIIIEVYGCKLKIGEFLITLFKVFLMFIIIFILQKNISSVKNKINTE